MAALNIMIGFPGSGKSSYAKKYLLTNNSVYLSSDQIRIDMYGFEDQTHNGEVFERMKRETILALQNGFDVIYDATNLVRKRREALIKDIKNRISNVEINAYLCCTPINIVLERNMTRTERHLPWDKLEQMIKSIEPPMYYEGFDNIALIDGSANHQKNRKWPLNTLAGYYFYNQNNPHHNYTLGAHIYTVANYYNNKGSQISQNDIKILYESGLWHDIAKPYARHTKDGISHYYNHEKLSAYMYLCNLLPSKKISINTNEYKIYQIIYHHMDFYKNINKTKEMLDDDTFRLLKLFHIADKYRINVPSEEIWSPIPNTDGLYYVSNYGNVKRNNKILKKYIQKSGHCRITISIKNKQKRFLIHRLVAQAFIPNPNNYKQVGHFDGNPFNNNVFNLYWCNQKQNINNEISRLKISSSKNKEKNPMFGNHKSRNRNKKVLCIETNILYDSIHNASVLTGINEGSIGACCRNKQLYTLDNDDNKYHWQFENENAIGGEV